MSDSALAWIAVPIIAVPILGAAYYCWRAEIDPVAQRTIVSLLRANNKMRRAAQPSDFTMSFIRRAVIILAACLFLLASIFPPWIETY